MYAESVRAEDLCITDEHINRCISGAEKVEWRSRKQFLDYIDENRNNMEWRIIGWVSYKTLDKWGKEPKIRSEYMKGEEETNYWVLCRGIRYWYVRSFLL